MRVAVASGKGGTGKTTVALGLALTAPGAVRLLDCDVEAPNLGLFLETRITGRSPVRVPLPLVDAERCDGCGLCSSACAFNALACMGGPPLVFPELCHGCGGCRLVCPSDAITETSREVGVVEWGTADGGIGFVQGRLDVGEAKAPPVIEAVKEHAADVGLTILDCPPGTSCSFVAAVRRADFLVLVTEPTPFGLSDLALAMEAARELGVPHGVVVNRAGSGADRVAEVCRKHGVPLLLSIPDDRRVAEAYARGRAPVVAVPGLASRFESLHRRLQEMQDVHHREVPGDVRC